MPTIKLGIALVVAVSSAVLFWLAPVTQRLKLNSDFSVQLTARRGWDGTLYTTGEQVWFYPSGQRMYARTVEGERLGSGVLTETSVRHPFPPLVTEYAEHAFQRSEYSLGAAECWLPNGQPCSYEQFREEVVAPRNGFRGRSNGH